MSNEIQPQITAPLDVSEKSIFASVEKFDQVKYMAEFLAQSDLVPKDYQKKPANVLIALSMAERMKADPMMIMQNLYVIHGRPSWSSQFLIACVNSCGRFSALQYEFFGTPNTDDWGCVAYATELSSNEVVRGPSITMAMAKAEGWHGKNGSKWKTLPELMLTYRAAAFFVRTKAPEISMGMHTEDEARDMGPAVVVVENEPVTGSVENMLDNLQKAPAKKLAKKTTPKKKAEPKPEPELEVHSKDVPEINMIQFFKQSIDSCTTIEDLEKCGEDIKASKDDDELSEFDTRQIKIHYDAALKSFKNQ